MSLCVPSLDVEDNHVNRLNSRRLKVAIHAPSNSSSSIPGVPRLDYEVAELTWKNGQIAMHGLGPPHVVNKYTWDKPRTAETLEAIVIQATLQPHHKHQSDLYPKDLVPWLDHHNSTIASGKVSSSAIVTKDALVPSSISKPYTLMSEANNGPTHGSMLLGSCSGDQSGFGDHMVAGGGEMAAHDLSTCRDQSITCSETFGMENSQQLTVETFEKEVCVNGFTSTSIDTLEHTVSGQRSTKSTSPDEHDSVFHSRPHKNRMEENKKKGKGKSSILIKRSREAAIHNQSERKRRDKINQKMKSLQKLVPNANKTDKASMLDEVIEYLKQLQAQINMMSRMNMSPMMMPLAMQQQQQFQMAMMNPVGMGMGMGMGMNMGMGMGMNMGMGISPVMDLNVIGGNRPKIPGMPTVFHPSNFIQPTMTSWDMYSTNNRVPNHNDPMPAFFACQSQPITMEGYSKMAALFQQMQNQQ